MKKNYARIILNFSYIIFASPNFVDVNKIKQNSYGNS